MEEAVVGATIQVLLQNLVTISQVEIRLIQHFKDDLEALKQSFYMVHGFLKDAEAKQVTDKAVKRWMGELEALAFEADNVVDGINYQLLSKKVGATINEKAKKKVKSFFSNNNPIAYRLKLCHSIRKITEKLESINQRAKGFGLQTIVAQAPVYVYGSDASGGSYHMETDSFSEDPVTLGRENDVSRIVEMLTTTSLADRKISVLPIVGMGGLGKTTLARLVFGDANIKTHFKSNLVWVHVPRNFDVLVLLKKILTSIVTTENVEHGNREALLKSLKTHLGAKKYLLVLDDVWNEDQEKWDDFVKSFAGISSANGNCMIVTTRSDVVASIVETLRVHKLKGLSKNDCWSIIKGKAFRGGNNPSDQFEAIGKNISEKCQGLPLAAKIVGGLLFDKSRGEWKSIEENWLSDSRDGNPISKILKLSFDNLSSSSLKRCFAYCSIFPKGHVIENEQLVELWMAEGFLQTDHQRSNINMETTGRKFCNLLLQNSLLNVAKRDDYGNVTHWNMHDLVHDLAGSVLCENDNVTDGISQRRYIVVNSNGDELLSIPKGQERYVRTLFFDGKVRDIYRLSNFESLRSLRLIDDLPTSIRELKHLRYLYISGIWTECLPDWIGELYHLQTLRVENTSYLKNLPDSLCYLISLRHLHIPKDIKLPPEMGKLTSLQTLRYFHVGSEKGCAISELGNMKQLKGELEIRNLEKVRDKKEAMSADLIGKTGIYDLRVVWDESREVDEANDESVLEGLQPHPNLKGLGIYGFKGKSLPQWTSKMAVELGGGCWEGLDNLMVIKIKDCSEIKELPALGHLPHLKSLHLDNLENVSSIGPSFYNIEGCKKSRTSNNGVCERDAVFRALEMLELLKMPKLIKWDGVDCPRNDLAVFPRLKHLKVEGCTKLTSAPSHFPCLEILSISGMKSSLPLGNICALKLTSLTSLTIKGIEGLECLPDNLHCLNALEEFHISGCKSLKSIPYPPSNEGFTSLRKLWIRLCKGLTDLPIEMVESCAPSLEELTLCELSSITNIPMVIVCLHRMPRLRELAISGVPKFSFKLLYNIGGLSTIDTLHIGPFSDSSSSWDDNVSLNEVVDDMLLQFTSVCKLSLSGKQRWECLPDQLQHLTSLRVLYLWNYGIEALPEWFVNLSSLEVLTVNTFKNLRRLPSKKAMLRLSKLKTLDILNCPLLLKDDDEMIVDSEWLKISHIPYITVDKTRHC